MGWLSTGVDPNWYGFQGFRHYWDEDDRERSRNCAAGETMANK